MSAELNHTIVHCRDGQASARFLAEILGRPEPRRFEPFHAVDLDNGVSLDFRGGYEDVRIQHYAFLIGEADFDAVLERIAARSLDHWTDPMRRRPGEINHIAGGRGVCFRDLDGHFLEVLTRPHGV